MSSLPIAHNSQQQNNMVTTIIDDKNNKIQHISHILGQKTTWWGVGLEKMIVSTTLDFLNVSWITKTILIVIIMLI